MSKALRKNPFLALAILLPLFSISCVNQVAGPYVYGELNISSFRKKEYEGYYKVGRFDEYESAGRFLSLDLTSVYQSGNLNYNMPSLGEVPLLVVPVDFSDHVGNESSIDYIDFAFNGNRGANQYVSVAEYYDLSSNGRLHLKPFVVHDYFRSSIYPTASSLSSISNSLSTTRALTSFYNEAQTWLRESHPEIDLSSFSFLSKAGKAILPIYFVYNAPYAGEGQSETPTNRSNMLWAFTINSPAPISWSSFDMLHLNEGKVDAHTFIHETGHLLGLEDYYDPSSTEALPRISHLGRMDMMDCSLGDHNAFSKMLLGWETPYVPTGDCTITLHQAEGNNESILFSSSWNGTPYDSYILMELYTPTLLNYVDSYRRKDPAMKLFEKPGIKIYRVDASLGLYNGFTPTGTYLSHDNYAGQRLSLVHNNSSASSPLIELLNKNRNKATYTPYFVASDHEEDVRYSTPEGPLTIHLSEALFFQGDGIDETHFADLYRNLGVRINVETLNASYAKIHFDF